MDFGHFLLLFIVISALMLVVQRAEKRRRLVVALVMLFVGWLVQRYANYRALHVEAQVAFVAALVFNGLFWLFIGRYNPVGSSDDIQVIGMDD